MRTAASHGRMKTLEKGRAAYRPAGTSSSCDYAPLFKGFCIWGAPNSDQRRELSRGYYSAPCAMSGTARDERRVRLKDASRPERQTTTALWITPVTELGSIFRISFKGELLAFRKVLFVINRKEI